MRYVEQGEGGPVVLLHGNGATVEDLALSGVLGATASRHHRTVAFDRPGYGLNERPRDRVWTPEAQASLLLEAFAKLGIDRPVIVGHSQGAQVALAMALEHPGLVSGLVLISGYYFRTGRVDLALSKPFAAPGLGDALRYTVLPIVGPLAAPSLIRQAFAPAPVPACFTARFPLDQELRPRPERASFEDAAALESTSAAFAPRYHELRIPVAIVAGVGDRLVDPVRQSVQLHRQVHGSSLTLIPAQGHMVHYGVPNLISVEADTIAGRR